MLNKIALQAIMQAADRADALMMSGIDFDTNEKISIALSKAILLLADLPDKKKLSEDYVTSTAILKLAALQKSKTIKNQDPENWNIITKELISKGIESSKHPVYVGLIYDHLQSGIDAQEGIDDAINTIFSFERIKNTLPKEKRDPLKYESYQDFNKTVQKQLLEIRLKKQERGISPEKALKGGHADIIFEDENTVVYRINDKVGSRAIGKDTPWCVTKPNHPYFEQYTANNLIFYFAVNKNLPKTDREHKMAIRAMRDLDTNKVIDLKATSKFNDGDGNPIDIVPNHEKFKDLIVSDAEQQPTGKLALIRSGRATEKEIKEYWETQRLASYEEKQYLINNFNAIKDSNIPEIIFFTNIHNHSEQELFEYLSNNKDAAVAEYLANITKDQEVLRWLYDNFNYLNVKKNILPKLKDVSILDKESNSVYNSVKMAIAHNPLASGELLEKIRANFEDDGNYMDEWEFSDDLERLDKAIDYRFNRIDFYSITDPDKAYRSFYELMLIPGVNIKDAKKLNKVIAKEPRLAYLFAKQFFDEQFPEDIQELQKAVMGSPHYAYKFAIDIPGADVSELQKAVMKDPFIVFDFAKYVPGADVRELQKALMNNPELALDFAIKFPRADVSELQKAVMKYPEYAYRFAKHVPKADVIELQKAAMNHPNWAYLFARDVPGVNIEELQEAVIKDSRIAFEFATDIPGADIQYIYNNLTNKFKRKLEEFLKDKKLEELAKQKGINLQSENLKEEPPSSYW